MTYLSIAVKVMKYQIVCPVNIEWKTFEIYLRTLSYHFRTIGNRTIQKLWEYDNQSLKHFKDTGQYPKCPTIIWVYSKNHKWIYL